MRINGTLGKWESESRTFWSRVRARKSQKPVDSILLGEAGRWIIAILEHLPLE